MDKRLLITIATLNEIENLPELVLQLNQLFPSASILVVDDDSPDGTGAWVEENSSEKNRLYCLHRLNETGLGSATIAGLKWGLDHDYEMIATMDADFSHPPVSLLEMVQQMEVNSSVDVVIGSRYVPGGAIEGWPISRQVGSRVVNWFARSWLGLPTQDNTGALRLYRANALRSVGLENLHSSGYAYLEELLYALNQNGFQVKEHPFTFVNREKGDSKLKPGVGLSVFRDLFLMRFRNYSNKK